MAEFKTPLRGPEGISLFFSKIHSLLGPPLDSLRVIMKGSLSSIVRRLDAGVVLFSASVSFESLNRINAFGLRLRQGRCSNGLRRKCPIAVCSFIVWFLTASFFLPIKAQSANPIVDENALPGTPQSVWEPGGAIPTIRGFTSEISVNKGEPITFFLQTPDAPNIAYDLVIYRLGYYQGKGAREITRFSGVTVEQPKCLVTDTPSLDAATDAKEYPHLIDCGNWIPSLTWTTPSDLVSGLFMAKVQRRDTQVSCGIYFVIRDDARHSDVLLQTSDTSWQAYNYGPGYQGGSIPPERAMDGHSAYDFINQRAYKVSYHRPYFWVITNTVAPFDSIAYDTAYRAVLTTGEEYPLIRYLEANGFDLAYTTGRDSDQRGELIRNHRLFITSGHDEYWSLKQRQNIQAARDAGVNLAFFSGNTGYWKIRWEDNYHTMVVFKERRGLKLDPLPGVSTGLYRDEAFGPPKYDGYQPENALLGMLGSEIGHLDYDLHVPEADGKLRFWRNTSMAQLAPGQEVTFTNLLGTEIDTDADNGFNPAGIFHVSTTEALNQDPGNSAFERGRASIPHHMSIYRAASGALVFHAGTMRIQRALAGYFYHLPAPPDVRLQQAIVNLFADMDVQPGSLQPGLRPATHTTDFTPPTAQILSPPNGASVKVLDTVVITGTAADTGGRVAAVEVSLDGGTTWHPATGRESWRYTFTPCGPATFALCARAVDDSANLGPSSSIQTLTAGLGGIRDFVANGTFDCSFDTVPDGTGINLLGHGWYAKSKSGLVVSLGPGGLIPGINLQRVVALGNGDGIGQDLTLIPGRSYTLNARVFVESGQAAVQIGRHAQADDLKSSITITGIWQTVSLPYTPTLADISFWIVSDGAPATFKVDDVSLTSQTAAVGPTISAIGNQTFNEDGVLGPISFTVSDGDTPLAALTLSATSTNTALISTGNIVFGGAGASRTVTLTPSPNTSGTSLITVSVSDGSSSPASTSFLVTVNPVNDPPTLSPINSQTINQGGTVGPLAFQIGDIDTPVNNLTVQVTLEHPELVPVARVLVGGTGANRTLTLIPWGDVSGQSLVTVTVSDGAGGSASTSFTMTILQVNQPPSLSSIAAQTLNEDQTLGPIALTVRDPDSALSSVRIQVSSSNPEMIPANNVVITGTGADRTVQLNPAPNAFGTARVTLTAIDDKGAQGSTSFNVTVTPVNDPPTITTLGPQTLTEDTVLGPLTVTVADVDNPVSDLTLTGSSSNTNVVPANNIQIVGTGADRSLTVTPLTNAFGNTQITLTVSDGNGGSSSTSFQLTVTPVNDAPLISAIGPQTIDEDSSTGPIPFTVSDIETPLSSLVVTVASTNPQLIPTNTIKIEGSTGDRTVTLTPVPNGFGTAQITLSVSDGSGGVSSSTFSFTVRSINDLPAISSIASVNLEEDEVSDTLAFQIDDVETAPNALTLSASTTNPELLPVNRILLGGSGKDRTVVLAPLTNAFGSAQITITVTDGAGGQSSTTFAVNVQAVNDAPTLSPIADQTITEDSTTGPISFNLQDVDSPIQSLKLKATSSNPSLIPVANIQFEGGGSARTVTLTPLPNAFGATTITLTASDDQGASAQNTFKVTVTPINDLPTLSALDSQTMLQDTTLGPIEFTIGDQETDAKNLVLKVTTSNSDLLPSGSLVFGGTGANRTLTITPTAHQYGFAQVTVTVSDADNGAFSRNFSLTVEPLVHSIVEENALSGVPQSTWLPGGSVVAIRGFTSEISVNKGEPLTFFIETPDASNIDYDLVIYRLGYYQGKGAREVARFNGTTVEQPNCLRSESPSLDPSTDSISFTELVDCGNWIPSWTWKTSTNLMSGLFMAKVMRRDTGGSCGLFFVIRDDTRASDVLLQTSDTTWEAYNYGPGYQGGSIPQSRAIEGHSLQDSFQPRAYKVSYRRPHSWAITNTEPPYRQISEDTSYGGVLSYGEEYPLIRFMEANGFDVGYTTGRDSDQRGELIRNHRLFITSGHDEYWSMRQRQNVEAARDAGVHLAFFSGNTSYWKMRWEDDYHTMVVFAEHQGPKLDPLPGVTTGLFRDPDFGPPKYDGYRPENALLGLLSSGVGFVESSLHVPESDGKLRFWRNTSVAALAPGEETVFDNLLGYEVDSDVDNGFRPAGLFHLSNTEISNLDPDRSILERGRSSVSHHLSLYRASSGAWVFHAGTMRLQRALAGYLNRVPVAPDVRLQQAIINLFADMDVQPASLQNGLVRASRSSDITAPLAEVTSPQDGMCAKTLDRMVVTGVAADIGGRVAAVEVSIDGGTTWHPASGREAWSYTFTPCSAGLYGICARAIDDSGNLGACSATHRVNAVDVPVQDFVINGDFDCDFDSVKIGSKFGSLGRGWELFRTSAAALTPENGGLLPGIRFQRITTSGSGDGIAQNLALAPGREYQFIARLFVESGQVALQLGSKSDGQNGGFQRIFSATGSWQSIAVAVRVSTPDNSLRILSTGGPAVFKVDDVHLLPGLDATSILLSYTEHPSEDQLEMIGDPGFTCCIQTSTNLIDWEFVFLGSSLSGKLLYPVSRPTSAPWRFYRSQTP